MTISGSAIRDNVSGVAGGGVWAADSAPVTITTSTLSGNHAGTLGGGVYAEDAAITIIASTLLGNSASQGGGGIYLNTGPLSLVNVTLAQNFADGNGGGVFLNAGAFDGYNVTLIDGLANADDSGGGLYRLASTVTLRNTIVADNRSVDNAHFVRDDDCFGAFGTFRYSLLGVTTGCTFTNDQTLTGQDPLLLPLAANGGPTLTQALGPGSPALDAADPAGCESPFGGLLLTDQRGQPRHADGNYDGAVRCDMGAYEAQRLLFLALVRR